jgi:hypothetical protein
MAHRAILGLRRRRPTEEWRWEAAFGDWADGMHSPTTVLDHSRFLQLREQMHIVPPFRGRCAVVGSSSSLLGRAEGARIDSADTVVRVNTPPVVPERWSNYTGTRTDVIVAAFQHDMYRLEDAVRPPARVYWCQSYHESRTCWEQVSKDHLYRASPGFVRRVRHSHGIVRWPSSGFIAFELANLLCNQTELFGFGMDPLVSNCTHYYNIDGLDPVVCRKAPKKAPPGLNSKASYDAYARGGWHDFYREHLLMQTHPLARGDHKFDPLSEIMTSAERRRQARGKHASVTPAHRGVRSLRHINHPLPVPAGAAGAAS